MDMKKEGVLLGALVADSLAMPAHWIYDPAEIERRFGRITELQAPPENSYHAMKTKGEFTHYGDQTLLLAQHMRRGKGKFSLPEFAGEWQQYMQNYKGYLDRATKTTLENLKSGKSPKECGSGSTDLGGAVRIAAILALSPGDSDKLLQAVTEQTAFSHNSPATLEGALFLGRCVLAMYQGATVSEAIIDSIDQGINDLDLDLRLRNAVETSGLSVQDAVKQFGPTCAINGALSGAVYTVLSCQDNLETALIDTVMAGGDSAARGMAVGMLLGAHLGADKIPQRWLAELRYLQDIKQMLTDSQQY